MMTHTSSRSRIITVWLVLLAFLCAMIVPSMALAKKDMTIATEGDPGDGMDFSGGGGSGVIIGDNNQDISEPGSNQKFSTEYSLQNSNESYFDWVEYQLFVPYFVNGQIVFFININQWDWGAIR